MTIAEAVPEETSSPGPFSMNREGGVAFRGQTSKIPSHYKVLTKENICGLLDTITVNHERALDLKLILQ